MQNNLRQIFAFFFFIATSNLVWAGNCPPPIILIAGSTTLCKGDSVKLSVNGGTNYKWSTGQVGNSIYAKTSGTYIVTSTDGSGCSATSLPVSISVLGAPDAALQDTVDNFMNCTYNLGAANFDLTVENNSSTKATNTKYTIEWGDGQASIYGANFTSASHTYLLPGSFNLKLTVTNAGGCQTSKYYQVFNGSNPSFGVASQGNTNDCAPATFTFDIINTLGNTPSTIYTFQFDDGTPSVTFTHGNLPKTLTHTFLKSAFGKPGNAFTLTAYATNPCGTTPATVGGIRISSTPKADFEVNPDSISCVNVPITLKDLSEGGFNANATGSSSSLYNRIWKILPATGWAFASGSTNTSVQPTLTFSKPGTYVVKLIVSPRGAGAKCQADSIAKNIVIHSLPKAAFTLSQANGNCAPALVTTQNQSVGEELTYNWNITPKTGFTFSNQTDSISANPKFTFTKAGSYKIELTATNRCGQSQKADSVIVINSAPTVSLPDSQQYCISQTVAFSAQNPVHNATVKVNGNAITGYEWQVFGTAGSSFVNGTTSASQFPVIKFPNPGTYFVSFKAQNACGFSEPDTQKITILPAPKVVVTSSVKAICAGQGATTLTASGADTYSWFPATGLNKTTGATVSANPSSTTTYSAIGTNTQTGCVDTTQFTVVVKPAIPLVVSASRSMICESQQTATLTASGADIFTWSPNTGLNVASGNTVIANPTVTTTYTVTATDTTAGCTATKTIKVEVVPLPTVNAGPDSTVCANPSGVTLKGLPAGGNWSGQNISAAGKFTTTTPGNYNVTYTFVNANGCIASDVRQISVIPMPQVMVGSDTTFCAQNATVLLKGSPVGGIWSGNKQVSANGTFIVNIPGVYNLTYTYGNGNCQVSAQKKITVYALPTQPTFANAVICPGETATLNLQGNATRFEWFDAFTGGNLVHTGTSFKTPVLQQSVTYYVVSYNTQGCATTQRLAVPVTVNPILANPTTADVTICGPGEASLTSSGNAATFEWYDAAVNGNLLFTGQNFKPTVSNTANFYVQAVSAEGCRSFSRTKATVFVQPVLTNNFISGIQTICEGATPAIFNSSQPAGGNNTFTYAWESTTDSLNYTRISAANAANLQSVALTQTTWFRRVVISGVCESISPLVKVTVIAKPQAPTIQNTTICAGNSVSLTLNNTKGLQYKWYNTASGGQLIFSGNTFTTPALQNTTEYYVQAINSQGCESATRTRVLVNVLPAIANNFITVNQTICTGETPGILNGSMPNGGNSNFTYVWQSSTDNNNWTAASGTNNAITYAPALLTQTTWFRRVVTSGPCTQHLSASVEITVLPGITNNTVSSQSVNVCFGNSPAIITGTQPIGGNGNYNYQWQSSTASATSGFNIIGSNGQNQNYQPNGLTQTTWFRRVVTSGNCSEVSTAVKIEVIPNIANNTIAANQTIYANTTPANLIGSAPTGGSGNYNFQWEASTDGVNFQVLANITNQNYKPASLSQTTWYRRTVISGDCDLASNVIKITVVPEITNNTIQADQTICQNNQPGILQGTQPVGGTGNYVYLWEMSTQSATSGFNTASRTNNQANYQPGILTQTTWFRRLVSSGAYAKESNVVQITVNPNIDNNLVSSAQTICANSAPAELLGTQPNGGSGTFAYVWESSTASATTGFITASGKNNTANYSPGTLQQTMWFRRRVSAGYCSDNVSPAIKITVNVVPAPPTLMPLYICQNTQATITIPTDDLAKGAKAFEWYESAAGGQLIATGTNFTTPALTDNKTYYVQTVQDGCMSLRTAVEVRVRENTADAGEDVNIIQGKSATLNAKGGVKYKWFPAEGLSNPAIANPVATPLKTTTYTLETTSAAGCTSTDQISVTVLPKISIPNTFTPNRDGINDVWEIKGLAEYRNCQVDIFNRWGQKVYSSVGYNKPFEGLNQSGEELPIATYYYIIQLKKDEAPISGSVTIVR
jgi:gliding motility-associated-like protein